MPSAQTRTPAFGERAGLVSCSAPFELTGNQEAKSPKGSQIVSFARGKSIYVEGDPVTCHYKVKQGAVRVFRILSDGHRQILEIFLPSSIFGIELASEHSETAEAVGEVIVERLPMVRADERTTNEHENNLLQVLNDRLARAYDHISMLGHQGSKQRVAGLLLRLAKAQGCTDNQRVKMDMCRQDMADYLGVTVETACRTISDLKLACVISTPDREHIVVHSVERLQTIVDGDA